MFNRFYDLPGFTCSTTHMKDYAQDSPFVSKEEFYSTKEDIYQVEYQCGNKRFNYESEIGDSTYAELKQEAEETYNEWAKAELLFSEKPTNDIGNLGVNEGD